jgi:hypothetical protein
MSNYRYANIRQGLLSIALVLSFSLSTFAATPEPPQVAPDISDRLARFRPVDMPFDRTAFTQRERQLIDNLVQACKLLDVIYWHQSDTEGWNLFNALKDSTRTRDADLRRLLTINGSRYDLIREHEPFVGTQPRPPGADLYPHDLTKAEIEKYVEAHPEQRAAIYNPFTVVRRDGTRLETVPYHVAYEKWLVPAAKALRQAAQFADDAAFAKFLKLRADALLTDDYFQSDVAWISLVNPKFDLIFAPYETYLDDLLGVKTSYGAAILIRDEEESRRLQTFQKYEADIQASLPLAAEDRPSKEGKRSPMEVMFSPFRAGDLRHGYQAVADNLPNDPRIHEQYGSKKIFFKNFMDARVRFVILPIAKKLLREDQAVLASADGYLATTMMHEISHGLGPAFARTASGRRDIREAIGGEFSGLEEAKADIVGLYGLKWLIDHDALPAKNLNGYYASSVAGILRTVRFGVAEAHGRAQMMEFNFLSEHGAIRWDNASQRYLIDFGKMPDAVAALAKELLEQEATGDAARVHAWFAKYGDMPEQLARQLESTSEIPVDIDPVSALD